MKPVTRTIAAFLMLLCSIQSSTAVHAGGSIVEPRPREAIPRTIEDGMQVRTWSLFLVCNPGWLVREKTAQLKALVDLYKAFGIATGEDHLAVLFVSDNKQLDHAREARYCRSFQLPADGPHIIVTSKYPNDWRPNDPFVRVSFGGRSMEETAKLIENLNHQVLSQQFSQKAIDRQVYWQAWERAGRAACGALKGMSVKVDAKFVGVEIKNVC